MHPLMPFLLNKVAAEEEKFPEQQIEAVRKAGKKVKRWVGGLGGGRVTKRELKAIERELKETKARGEKEKKLEQLAGRKWTTGQYLRGAGVGAGMGLGAHTIGSLIKKEKVLRARPMAAASAIGAIYGSALPAARRLADIEAAKKGKY